MNSESKTSHLLIAGTGRAGTSFLVRYLTAMGLDTHLSRNKQNSGWDENANAGFEDIPLSSWSQDLPYVIKCPWLYEFIDQVLSDFNLVIDAVIIPIRDLVEAASSRSILERKAMYGQVPWMSYMDETWETWAVVPGGIVYSVNPIDQARLLAVYFHHLVHKLIQANIPIILLDFPRFINDADYLFSKLKPFIPDINHKNASRVHLELADPSKVRVEKELESAEVKEHHNDNLSNIKSLKIHQVPSNYKLENIAIRRELIRLRKELTDTQTNLSESRNSNAILGNTTAILQHRNTQLENELNGMKSSRSWRMTKLLRKTKSLMWSNLAKQKNTDI